MIKHIISVFMIVALASCSTKQEHKLEKKSKEVDKELTEINKELDKIENE